MKTNITKFCTAAFGTMVGTLITIGAAAQVTYPYSGDFEAATTTVGATTTNNKSYASTDTVYMNGAKWIMPQVFMGTMLAADRKVGDRSGRMRSQPTELGQMFMAESVTQGVGQFSYKAARYGTDAIDSIDVFYSSNNGLTWNLVGTDPITDTIMATFSHAVNVGGNVRMKLQKRTFATARVNIDDIGFTSYAGPATQLNIVGNTPSGNNVSLTVDSITIEFSAAITAGTGDVKLFKVGQATAVTTFPVSAGAITGSRIKFSPIVLDNATSYYVLVDSAIVVSGAMANQAITDTNAWTFATEDTVTPPPPTPLTSLNEKFENCVNTEMGVFVSYSETGTANWRCSRFGRNKSNANADSFAVYINGGSTGGVSNANKDWLISNAPFDFSAMNQPMLSFWQNRRFGGNVTRKVLVSTDYIAGTDPSVATWVELNIPALANDPDSNIYKQVKDINLTAHKATPFYLAFTYECATDGAYELTYDDIRVDNAVGINNIKRGNVGIQVLGEATNSQINLNIDAIANDNVAVQLFDMLGRAVATKNVTVVSGANKVNLTNLDLGAGIYVIRVIGQNGFGSVKTVVK